MNSKEKTNRLKTIAKSLIPAGAHTYSRADNQFPECAPAFVSKAKGCLFWDENGVEYIDYGMGLLSVSIGHANETINSEIKETIDKGVSFSRPSILEGELAEKIHSLIPSAEMVKFTKNGSDATSAAIRLARSFTGKKYIVRCSQQPFLSFEDWFISSTSKPGGIPNEMSNWVLRFNYNDIKSLEDVFTSYKNEIACVIMEPFTNELPHPGFLENIKALCEKNNSLLIFDEMITGFRVDLRGAQNLFKVTPHLSTFGKGIANGYALAVLCGSKEIMQQGGMNGNVFLLSCTYGGETVGLSASLATINFMEENKVPDYMAAYGTKLYTYFQNQIELNNLSESVILSGHPARLDLKFIENNETSFALKTLFMQEMMLRGIFMERISISYSHSNETLEKTKLALKESLNFISVAIKENTIKEKVIGKIVEPVFTR